MESFVRHRKTSDGVPEVFVGFSEQKVEKV